MTDLTVRRLLIDLDTPFGRNWCGGDAFRTALFNALSMSFPLGEQFFIDAVRNGLQALPADRQVVYQAEVQGFVGQEATHRRMHSLFNAHLTAQGLQNRWEPRARRRLRQLDGLDPRHHLAATAANEHFTAIFAEWLLKNHDLLDGAEPRLKTLWLWHSAEESEHKSTAFDLYQALGGSHAWRLRWFRRITLLFLSDALRQTLHNLRVEGQLWRWRTWASAATDLFGRRGLIRQTFQPWKDYLKRDFHPSQQPHTLSADWLRDHTTLYRPVSHAA